MGNIGSFIYVERSTTIWPLRSDMMPVRIPFNIQSEIRKINIKKNKPCILVISIFKPRKL